MLQRILKIFGVILLLAAFSGAGGVYLLHHNRNQIANYLTGQLRQHSDIDINIAKTSVGFRQGITFDMLGVHARSDSGHFDLKSPRIHIRLKLLSLLQGEIISTRAELREPEIVWHLTADSGARSATNESPSFPTEQSWSIHTDTLSFILSTWRRIVCSDASIEIHPGEHAPLKFSHANLSLTQAGIDTPLQADLSGQMHTSAQDDPMHIHMKTRLSIPSSESTLPLARINTTTSLHLRSIDAAEANKYLPAAWGEIDLHGRVEFEASLEGSLAQGLDLRGSIRNTPANGEKHPLQLNYNGSSIQPGNAEFSGTLTQASENGLKISSMNLQSTLFRAQGNIRLTPKKQHADISCSSAPINYAQLRPWFKDLPFSWKERLHKGQITCTELHYSGPLNPPVLTGVQSSRWIIELPALIPTEYTAQRGNTPQITLEHAGDSFQVRSSALEWNTDNFSAKAALDMQGEWNAQHGYFSASIDLTQSVVEGAGIDIKTKTSPAQLRFTFRPRPQGWEIFDAILKTPEIDASCSAEANGADSDFRFNLQLSQFDLNSLRTRIPILDFMKLGGKVDLDYSLKRQNSSWNGNGTLTLHDGSIHPASILGRIHHVNATADIDGFRLKAPDIVLQLGKDASPMRASVSIADLRKPVADIHATGDGVVANDLIFNSRTALLQNLEGHIRIHADGIDFVSARVDLEQGTHAKVRGVLGFSTPDLDMDIHATYADIDEVIALWRRGDKAAEKHTPEQDRRANIPAILPADETLFIDASVDTGVFSGFTFQDAKGRINIQRGQLRVAPLEFHTDTGKGNGEIVVTTTADPYLNISGVLENIDADKVYTQIFEDLGLITGDLNGTFSLRGPIGNNFSANAAGDFKVDVRDGVLRQFTFLSKAFSLLNVAQLFKMQLPDMATEGMPFKRLSADLSMEDGVLRSNNLLIRSEAMNLALAGNFSLPLMQIDATMALNPLGTVDSIFSKIPVAGWLLTGEKKTFITVEFDISGPAREPIVSMKPLSSVSNQMFGILKRALTLPGTTLTDPGKVFFHQGKNENEKEER